MIPDIGVMIAAYILTRMWALVGQPNTNESAALTFSKVLAVITMLVAVISGADLLLRGLPTSLHSMN